MYTKIYENMEKVFYLAKALIFAQKEVSYFEDFFF